MSDMRLVHLYTCAVYKSMLLQGQLVHNQMHKSREKNNERRTF